MAVDKKLKRKTTGYLTIREKFFAYEYLLHGQNATVAYMNAYGVKRSTAKVEGCRLLKSERVANFIDQLVVQKMQEYDISLGRIFQELAALGFSNATDVVGIDEEGKATFKDTDKLDEGTQRAIAKIHVIGSKVNIEMHDKVKPLMALAKYQGAETEFNQLILGLPKFGYKAIRAPDRKIYFIPQGTDLFDIDPAILAMMGLDSDAVEVEAVEQQELEQITSQEELPMMFINTDEDEAKAEELKQLEAEYKEKLNSIQRSNPYK